MLLENVPGLLNHDGGRIAAISMRWTDWGILWNGRCPADFGVPQSRKRVYLIGYLDKRCRKKYFLSPKTAGTPLIQIPEPRGTGLLPKE
ncbi:MAG: DNA cytosine methyltransferase [[Clostridium] leptum]